MSFVSLVRHYLQGMEPFDESRKGVTINKIRDTRKVLYDGVLMNRDGSVIRKYSFKYLSYILPDGKYLAQDVYEGKRWGLFSKEGKEIWIKNEPIHHEILVYNKLIYTLSKEMHTYKSRNVDFCTLRIYNFSGKMVKEWSTWKNLHSLHKHHKKFPLDFPKRWIFDVAKRKQKSPWGGWYDYYRINSIDIISKNYHDDARFQKGNIILSMRHGSIIVILDGKTYDIVYSLTQFDIKDEMQGQHAVQMLKNGNLLIFDNGRYRGWSRIIELNPISKKIEWEYKADNFFTESRGYVQKTSSGNYFITESEKGRIFEITPKKEIVWEWFHPQKQNNPHYPQSIGKREWVYRARLLD